MKKLLHLFLALSLSQAVIGQKVGLVLSGGGVNGLAHIGVLKALEENGIKIDYITGTSAGALVGGLYAAGYSPEEIEGLLMSDKFLKMAQGQIEDKFIYYFKQPSDNPSWINIRFSKDSIKQTTLPTNLVSPTLMDYEMMAGLTDVSALAKYNFDSLFIPFRCVASDIVEKKSVVFKEGNLYECIRASMTYPFYLKPIYVNGKLLFDGGLYDNFPADVMYNSFLPDVIIGSNVSGNAKAPTEDNIRSQLINMIVVQQDFTIKCENGIILNPQIDISTFDFSSTQIAIKGGYEYAIKNMDSIKKMINTFSSKKEIQEKRQAFKNKLPPVVFKNILITGLNKRQTNFVKRTILDRKDSLISLEELKPRYFRIFNDERISFIYPRTKYNPLTKTFDLNLEVKKDKEFEAFFGGNFSSLPINTGFIGINYHLLSGSAWTISASSSFGKLYSSGKASVKFEPPSRIPFFIEADFVIHRWDFYKSFSTFFEDIKPSYIVQEEKYTSLNFGFPIKNRGKLILFGRISEIDDNYYQVENFLSSDTADLTRVYANLGGAYFERSTLNKKQLANRGTYLYLGSKLVSIKEFTIPGSTSILEDTIKNNQFYPLFKFEYQNYFERLGPVTFGFHTEWVYSFQKFYGNYISSVLSAPGFQPIPQSQTLFLPQYKAYQYATFGLQTIITFKRNFDFRLEGYIFQPYQALRKNLFSQAVFTEPFQNRFYIASSSLNFHSPIGPISISLNYYHKNEQQLYFLFNVGYIIFNKASIRQ